MNLFTKTCRKDFEFLRLAFVSVLKHAKDEVFWVFVCDTGEREELLKILKSEWEKYQRTARTRFHIVETQEHWRDGLELGDGYIVQQWVKMNAHRVMNGEHHGYFLNWDSDVIALRPFCEADFKNRDGKPIMFFTPFNDIIRGCGNDSKVHQERRKFLANMMQMPVAEYEYMRTMPIWMHSDILRAGMEMGYWERMKIGMKSRMEGISEFLLIGAVSHFHYPDAYDWRNTETGNETWSGPLTGGKNITHQGWSWGGVPEPFRTAVLGK